METLENYVIPAELAQAILNYFGERPYREVAHLANTLRQIALQQDAEFAERRKAAPAP